MFELLFSYWDKRGYPRPMETDMNQKPLGLPVGKTAKLIGRSSKTVLRRIKDGTLEAQRINDQYIVIYRSIERILGIDEQPGKTAA